MRSRKQKLREAEEKYIDAWLIARKRHEKGEDEAALQLLEATINSYGGEVGPAALQSLYRDAALLHKQAGQHDTARRYAVMAAELGSNAMRAELSMAGIAWRPNQFQMEKTVIEGIQNDHIILLVIALMLLTLVTGHIFDLALHTQCLICLFILGYGIAWFTKRIATLRQAVDTNNFYYIDTLLNNSAEAIDYRRYIFVASVSVFYIAFGEAPWYMIVGAFWCGFLLPNIASGFRFIFPHLLALLLAAVAIITGIPYYLIASLCIVALHELYCIILKQQ